MERVLRGEVGKVYFGEVHCNHSYPGLRLGGSTKAVSNWQQDAEARMGSAGLGGDGSKEVESGTVQG